MSDQKPPTDRPFTAFRSAAEEAEMKTDREAPFEGGHMSSTSGRVGHVRGSHLPYVVTLTHHDDQTSEHAFASMREAEAFIKRNTPVPLALFPTTYDRPVDAPASDDESSMSDDSILARLKIIDERMRQISSEEAASVLAGGLAQAGIHQQERLRLIAETERILDELDGKTND